MTAEGAAAAELQTRLRRHAEAVAGFLAIGRQVPAAAAGRPRAGGKWTPVQEALHLALTYHEYTAVFEGAPEFSLLVPADKATHYRNGVLPRILAGGWFPSGAAAPERVRPDASGVSLADALTRLESAAERFHTAARDASAGSKSWMHPYFGPLSLAELLDLLTEHAHHHARFLTQAAATE